jgi:adenosylmethionine---8-amino-7-oxononanoate aminotransferase
MNPTLIERDQKVIWHPFTPQKYAPNPVPIAKGDGVLLFDINGKSYIDAISSWWVTIHGHAHPYIAQKVYEQAMTLEQVIFAGFTHEPAVQLAERLLNLLQGPYSKIFYSDNGSTATEVAVKMAIQYWHNQEDKSRTRILALKNSYHGDTFGAMSVSHRSVFTVAFSELLFEVEFIDAPVSGENFLPRTIENLQNVACFIYEPLLQGAGGMKMYPADGLNTLIKYFQQNGIICIADEVMTGFGRTGKLFASDYCSQKADIVCLSKGLTGGTMPMGITACNEKIYEAYVDDDPTKTFFHGHSFTANPLACAASLASIDLLTSDECKNNIQRIANKHEEFVSRLKTSPFSERIKNLRQLGTIVAFEWEEQEGSYLNNISLVIRKMALDRGLFIRPLGNTVYLMPPYCITDEQLERVYGIVVEILEQLS